MATRIPRLTTTTPLVVTLCYTCMLLMMMNVMTNLRSSLTASAWMMNPKNRARLSQQRHTSLQRGARGATTLAALRFSSSSRFPRPPPQHIVRHQSSLSSSSSPDETSQQQLLADRLEGLDRPTVWHEFSPLAVQHGAVNLGQGFPDWDPPAFVQQAMTAAVDPSAGRHANQYARSAAHMPLATVLADEYSQRWNRPIDAATEVATAVGCTNALYCALQGLVNPGDQVILLEPAFDIYYSQVRLAGGVPVFVPLRPTPPSTDNNNNNKKDPILCANQYFQLDFAQLQDSITDKTKVLLLNTPHNPTGKMFSATELQQIADICRQHPQITVISDEVYEHIVFDPVKEPHCSIATLLWDQTLTLSSSGKTFSCTGWKVGWAVGPSRLVAAVTAVQQWCNFSTPTPNQDAIAVSLPQARLEPYKGFANFYDYLADDYQRKRQALIEALESAGMTPVIPAGGFFIMADTSHIDFPYEQDYQSVVTDAMPCRPMPRDWALSRWLTETVGVTAIPPSAFYSPETVHLAQNLLRFAFCKNIETIQEAQRRFEKHFGDHGSGGGGSNGS